MIARTFADLPAFLVRTHHPNGTVDTWASFYVSVAVCVWTACGAGLVGWLLWTLIFAEELDGDEIGLVLLVGAMCSGIFGMAWAAVLLAPPGYAIYRARRVAQRRRLRIRAAAERAATIDHLERELHVGPYGDG